MARATRIRTGNSMTRIEGFDEIIQLLETIRTRVPSKYDEVLLNVSQKIEVDARQRINSQTGKLESSLNNKKKKIGEITAYEISAGGSKAPHAHLVEFGHRQVSKDGTVVGDVPARPFLRSAFEDNKASLVEQLDRILDQALRG